MYKLNVSTNELLQLRQQGYSNHDIAKLLDISMTSVYRRIGGQGCKMERLLALQDTPKVKQAPAAPAVSYTPMQVLQEKVADGSFSATIDYTGGLVEVLYEQQTLLMSFEAASDLLVFMQALGAHITRRLGDVQ